jgi:hypothetical protein
LDHIKEMIAEGKITKEDGDAAIEAEREAQVPEMEWDLYVWEKLDKNEISEDEAQAALEARVPSGDPPPSRIKGVSRFFQDLAALTELLSSTTPPEVNVRS